MDASETACAVSGQENGAVSTRVPLPPRFGPMPVLQKVRSRCAVGVMRSKKRGGGVECTELERWERRRLRRGVDR